MTLARILLFAFLLASCSYPTSRPTPAPSETLAEAAVTATTETTQAPEPLAVSTSTPQTIGVGERPFYSFRVAFDYAAHYLRVQEQVRYFNRTGEPLSELLLIVEAQRQGAGFNLFSLTGTAELTHELSGAQLLVSLAEPLNPGEVVVLDLDYELAIPAGTGFLAWTDRQANLIDWYPYVAAYSQGGWLAHEPGAVGEHVVFESADFEVYIEVLNAPASLELAAPAPATAAEAGWFYRLENARRFVWSASGQYEKLEAQQGGVSLTIFFYEEHRDAAEAALEVASQSVELYSDQFGAYPYESLSVVEALFPDDMESDGLFFLDQFYFRTYSYDRQNYLTTLSAHEVAHNWWFGKVGSDQAEEPWLDEALAIYSELLYYERFYPDQVDWWWDFRIERFEPTGAVDSSVYDHAGFDAYVRAVYMRGALFLRDLRALIGDGAFFALLRDYAESNAGAIATAEDFFNLLPEDQSRNIDALLAKYFERH